MSDSIEQLTFTDGWADSSGTYSGSLKVDYNGLNYYGTITVTSDAGNATFNTGPNGATLSPFLSQGSPPEYYFSIFDSSPTQSITFEWRTQTPTFFDSVQYFSPTYPNGPDYGQAFAMNGAVTATPACYCTSTLILTDRGNVPVEALLIGDTVVTTSGEHRPIKWIGHRSYAGRFLAANLGMQPVRFRAGSLGDGLPQRDLLVSPEHAMFLDGLLIPACHLVNGTGIVQECALDRVDYYHVELDTHDVLLAEGAPSESFLDDDSRGMFHNAAEFMRLYPDAPDPGRFCAPKVTDGYEVEAIRRRLAVVAGNMALAA